MKLFPVVILAGGLATRLQPLSNEMPKSLIEINGEPFIYHQLRMLQKQGVRQVLLCVGYLGEKIIDCIGAGENFKLEVTYSFDGEILLGTAGAIKKAWAMLPNNFFVLYGDSYLNCDFAAIQTCFVKQNKNALMTVFKNTGQWDASNIEYCDGQIIAYDKKNKTSAMQYIDYGLGIWSKKIFSDVLPNKFCDLSNLYQNALEDNQLSAYEVHERFYEIGSFAGINDLRKKLATSA